MLRSTTMATRRASSGAGIVLTTVLLLTGCSGEIDGTASDTDSGAAADTAQGDPSESGGDDADAGTTAGTEAGDDRALGSATVAVDGQEYSFDVVACVQDLVIPEADGTVVATLAGTAPGTPAEDRAALAELPSFGNGLASTIETVLSSLEGPLASGPVVAFERFESTDGQVEDRVRVLLADGTTIAAVGEVAVTVGDGVEASGALPAVSRASEQTMTPYEGTSVGELSIDASCS